VLLSWGPILLAVGLLLLAVGEQSRMAYGGAHVRRAAAQSQIGP
jgi:hypothetical protein